MIEYSEIELRLRAECEKEFPVGQGTSMYLSVTGELYTEFMGGIYLEGEQGRYFPTIEAAYEAQISAFRRYAAGKSGAIYWRVYPELGQGPDKQGWGFYMRLLVSDMPALKKDDPRVKSYWEELAIPQPIEPVT